jgi:hypothetical protein
MERHVAIHQLHRNPRKELVFTGKYDSNGEPIVRAASETVEPGSVFTPADKEERDFLLSVGASRPITETEETLFDSGVTTSFPREVRSDV